MSCSSATQDPQARYEEGVALRAVRRYAEAVEALRALEDGSL